MNFLIFLIISLVLVTIALIAIGLNILPGRKYTVKAGSCGCSLNPEQKESGRGCSGVNCYCAAE